jgi:O-antigen/teichoic acid export membrane protein
MTTLTHRTTKGILWTLAQQLAVRGLSVLVTLVLAWYLTPIDYGLIAMMAVFIAIANSLMDSGFKDALIRLPEARPEDFNTAFFANLTLGLCAYALLYLSAPLIADFYSENDLVTLVRVSGIVVVINAFQVVQTAQFTRDMNFKIQFKASIPASILSAFVAIFLAYFDYGVWALVGQMIMSAVISTLIIWRWSTWRLGKSVSLESLKQMYKFGYKLFLTGLIDTGFKNMYVIVIAKLFSTSLAGLYFFADRMREIIIFQLIGAIQKVTYPALSTIQSDKLRMKQGYRKLIRLTSFILFPIILLIAALADTIFQLLLPERWWQASFYLQLMCLAGVIIPINAINLNILKVLGRSDLILGLEVIKKSLFIVILVISSRYGIKGILVGQIIMSILAYIPNSYYSKSLIVYGVKQQMLDFMPSLILAGSISYVVWRMQVVIVWGDLTKLFILGFGGVLVYLTFSYVLRFEVFSQAKQLLKK